MISRGMEGNLQNIEKEIVYLHPDFIVGVFFVSNAVRDRVDDVDLEEVSGRGVGIVQRLFLA